MIYASSLPAFAYILVPVQSACQCGTNNHGSLFSSLAFAEGRTWIGCRGCFQLQPGKLFPSELPSTGLTCLSFTQGPGYPPLARNGVSLEGLPLVSFSYPIKSPFALGLHFRGSDMSHWNSCLLSPFSFVRPISSPRPVAWLPPYFDIAVEASFLL